VRWASASPHARSSTWLWVCRSSSQLQLVPKLLHTASVQGAEQVVAAKDAGALLLQSLV
jgi:hypothetical protein